MTGRARATGAGGGTGGRSEAAGSALSAAAPSSGGDRDGPAATAACPACGEGLLDGARFCEACGVRVGEGGEAPGDGGAAPEVGAVGQNIPATADSACVRCQAPVGPDGYCTMCGHKALEPVTVDDRDTMAYGTHRGRRHERNEDAAALAATSEGWPVLVVSDGVSVSPNPHLAAAAAVVAASARLAGRPFTGSDDLVAAVDAAHVAASEVPADGDPYWTADGTQPACTIVVAVATATEVHVANVGDARAHLLTGRAGPEVGWQATQLTTDDSTAAQAVAEGFDVGTALALPGGHAITAWLGADAPPVAAHLAAHPLAAGDVVLASSDGLWNYAPTDETLADLASATLPPPGELLAPPGLGARCEQLVSWAVDQGGADNVTVAIAPAPGPELGTGAGPGSELAPEPGTGAEPELAPEPRAAPGPATRAASQDPQHTEREEPA